MPTNQQRRDAERRRLQLQLEERREREIARRRMTLIGSIIGTLVVIAAVVVIVVVSTSGKDSNTAGHDTITNPPTAAATTSSTPAATTPAAPIVNPPTAPCSAAPKTATATYKGVAVTGATNLKAAPKITSKGTVDPPTVLCQDLVVGKGQAATPTSAVSVQYSIFVYRTGAALESSWTSGRPAQFSLSTVVPGFSQGIGGAGKVAPMRVGGRRLMIIPPAAGYGAAPPPGSGIPANATLVFIVDLTAVNG